MKVSFLSALLSVAGCIAVCGSAASILDVIPFPDAPVRPGEASVSFDYTPSGSEWHPRVSEEAVFLASLTTDAYRLGIGKGGQIYSLRGPYGESVPPQREASPWNDEVWQLVITSEERADPIQKFQVANPGSWNQVYPLLYFVHQAGIYVAGAGSDGGRAPAPFYSPCLEKRWDPETRTLSMVNWIQQARTPCVWKSEVLLYTAYRDLGEGVLEVNQVLHNFGTETLDYLSTPWGGVRKSSLPVTVVSAADGSWDVVEGTWGWHKNPERALPETGGWAAWTQDPDEEGSPALALVFGRKRAAPSPAYNRTPGRGREGQRLFLWGTAGEGAERDYEVAEQVTKLHVGPGDSLHIRWYLVSGTFGKVRAAAARLAPGAGVEAFVVESGGLQPVWSQNDGLYRIPGGVPWAALEAFPVRGTRPLFVLRDRRNGERILTADPYALAPTLPVEHPLPPEHPESARYTDAVTYLQYMPYIEYETLMGYARTTPTAGGGWVPVRPPEGMRGHASLNGLWMRAP